MRQQVATHEPDNAAKLTGSPRALLAGQSITEFNRNAHKKCGRVGCGAASTGRLTGAKHGPICASKAGQKERRIELRGHVVTAVSKAF